MGDFIPVGKPSIGEEEYSSVKSVLQSGWLSLGPKTHEFEQAFAKRIGSKMAVGLSSCTAGLFLSLKALGIKEGDEVITTPLTFVASVSTIKHCGASPVLVDVQKDTLNIDPSLIRKAITKRTKAIVPVHYAGHPCEMDEIQEIANEFRLKVIEDAAHALGSRYKGKVIGSFSDIASFSFYANKNITTGDGGMITTSDEKLAEKIRILRLHGLSKDGWKRYSQVGSWVYDVVDLGYKYNMTDLQAAIGLAQLQKLDKFNEKRKALAEVYNECLKGVSGIEIPSEKEYAQSSWFSYSIIVKCNEREKVMEALRQNNIGFSVFFIPVYHFSYYAHEFNAKNFPVTESVASGIITLPLYPDLTTNQVQVICGTIINALK